MPGARMNGEDRLKMDSSNNSSSSSSNNNNNNSNKVSKVNGAAVTNGSLDGGGKRSLTPPARSQEDVDGMAENFR